MIGTAARTSPRDTTVDKPCLTAHSNIIANVLSYCDRKTLVTCLRVSFHLQDLAGDTVYHRIKIGGKTFKGVFMGAINDPQLPLTKVGQHHGTKHHLLAKVKVVTLSNHHGKDCSPLAHALGNLFPKLRVVRVVLDRDSIFETTPVCFPGGTPCPLLNGLDSEHLVYRNIGATPVFTENEVASPQKSFEMVTYVFPADGRLCFEQLGIDEYFANNHFDVPRIRICFCEDEGPSRNMMVECDMEDFDDYDLDGIDIEDLEPDFFYREPETPAEAYQATYGDMYETLSKIVGNPETRYEICGGEVLGIDSYDNTWVEKFRQQRIAEMKKDHPDYDAGNIVVMTRQEWKKSEEAQWEMDPTELDAEEDPLDTLWRF